MLRPESPEQLAEALQAAASQHRTILLGGNFSKDRLAGKPQPADVTISTTALNRLIQYDPRDLTVSVQAGMRFAELERLLGEQRQMLPLDPGWDSTVGGVVAANLSGPRRRLHGTARDMIIGMKFATLEGKLISSGGMVVKNVAGLDMAKLIPVGSFGTLARHGFHQLQGFSRTSFRPESRTFEMQFATATEAFAERDRILESVLQPAAIDIVNWPSDFRLLLRAGGNANVLDRYARELPGAAIVDESEWEDVREFTPRFLAANPEGFVLPIPLKFTEMAKKVDELKVPVIVRAGSGVIYAHFAKRPEKIDLAGDFAMMTKVKEMFAPEHLLNRGSPVWLALT